MSSDAYSFLSSIQPFTFLSEEGLTPVADQLIEVTHPRETVLLIQGQNVVEHVYLVRKGLVERYYREKDQDFLHLLYHEKGLFGAISMLLRGGMSIATFKTIEDTDFYLLPKDVFLDLYSRHQEIADFFTDQLGKFMVDKSFATAVVSSLRHADDGPPQIFNQNVENIFTKNLVWCGTTVSVKEAAANMAQHQCSSILLREPEGDFVGIITDRDLRDKIIVHGACDMGATASQIMSSPLETIPAKAPLSDALTVMMLKNLKHLGVTDDSGGVIGIITSRDILEAHSRSPFFLLREINGAHSFDEIRGKHSRVPGLIHGLIKSGAKVMNVARMVSVISDAILNRLAGFAIDELGPPPARFAFMIVGSEGRREQTLKTDQDNAIVFEDVSRERSKDVMAYFLAFGEKVCNWLNEAGYTFCNGGIMAKNPQWCQPLSVWKHYFSTWIGTAEPEGLLQSSIFFDFRTGYGDTEIIDDLRDYMFRSFDAHPNFFRYLAETTVERKPPLGLFGSFMVETKDGRHGVIDVKVPMITIVNYTRVYALKNRIAETNTLERMYQLYLKKGLSWEDYQDFQQAYSFLMRLRLERQLTAIMEENAEPDNYITPNKLPRLDRSTLRAIFKRIERYQSKLVFDFWK
ncbi:MAG: DUF294 nucleotidyltransferase-like domain-containing protein [Syntrophales bacterium]|jgi:CBS domain-containing protein|nr:DUF294 nucleotidyltransferase-like domain-containing protein [Syntrophales bacterium]MDX9921439.1 DUF294 nucleotidyltransferase-like domain-containing protein [Syntrophales bacterium]